MTRIWVKRLLISVVIVAAVAGAAFYFAGPDATGRTGAEAQTAQPTQTQPSARELSPVEVTTIQPASKRELLRVSGELRPINRASIRARVSGKVIDVEVRQGQAVKSGDVLVRFETEDLQSALVQQGSNLEAARAQLELAEQTLAKTEELARRGFATTSALEKAQSDVTSARANVQGLSAQTNTARTALRDAELLAPFSGIIAGRSIEPGETVNANTELLTLVDTSILEAEVLVSTRDITRLEVGQRAELQVDGLDGRPVVGTVDRISPVANEGTRFVPVHIRLENTDGRLWGGMFATGDIILREGTDVLALPLTAIRGEGRDAHVLKLVDGVLVRQPVETGPRWDAGASVQIVSGVAAGDTVVIAPLPELDADMPVVVTQAN